MSQTVTRTQRHKTKSQKNKPVLMAGFLIGQFCCVVLNTLHIAFIALRMALLSQRASVGQLVQVNAAVPWRARVRSVSVQAKQPTLRQSVTLERHMETA